MIESKPQPQALDFEELVIGAILLEKSALIEVIDILKPEAFYKEAHQKIYQAVLDLHFNSNPVDISTVANQLRSKGELENIGGPVYIIELTNRIASAENIEYHSRIIMQQYFRRVAIRQATELITNAYDDTKDVFQVCSESVEMISNVFANVSKDNSRNAKELTREVLLGIEKNQQDKAELTGVPTGFIELDKVTGGLQSGNLVILAARPAMGKTALATQIGSNAVKAGYPVYISSLEMPSEAIMSRIIASELEIDSKTITKNQKDIDLIELQGQLGKSELVYSEDLIIDDSSGITINELVSKFKKKNYQRESRGQKKIGLLIVDYLQLLYANDVKGFREQEISEISRKLKELSKELKIPVLALSQLSRQVEQRSNKRPQLSDLRESGSIEQDADIVTFLLRPEYYGINQDENGNTTHGKAIVIFAKNRNGSVGDKVIRFQKEYTKFSDMEIQHTFDASEQNEDEPF